MSAGAGSVWDRVIGQQPAKTFLRASLRGGRGAHGYLFKGPPGVGKRSLAYVLAQVAACTQRPAPDEACGACRSCRWYAARQGDALDHPDHIPLVKFTGSPDKEGRREAKAVGDHEPGIPLESVQHACEQLHRTPMAGDRRVLIVPEAQRLCRGQAEPANAFLKTLEEPPASSLIVLTSSQPEGLLETIISRVQGVQLRRLTAKEIETALAERCAQVPEGERAAAAQLSDGSLGRALELLQGDLKTWRAAVLAGLNGFGPQSCPAFGLGLWRTAEAEGKRLFEQSEAQDEAGGEEDGEDGGENDAAKEQEQKTEAGWKRFVMKRLLELCETCFRDALVCAAGVNPAEQAEVLLQPDQGALAVKLGRAFGTAGCEQALAALKDAQLALRLYVRGDIIGRALAGRLVDGLRGGKDTGATR